MKKEVHYQLILSFLGDKPNEFADKSFNTPEEAKEFWENNFKNRNKGDGHDEYWNNIPLNIMRVEKEYPIVEMGVGSHPYQMNTRDTLKFT